MDKERNFLEVEGDSVEDAIKRGIDLLKTSAENVDIEILNEPSNNFLQFRRKKAKVRITLLRGFVPASLLRKEEEPESEKPRRRERVSVADVMENKPREGNVIRESVNEKPAREERKSRDEKPNSFKQYREQRQQNQQGQSRQQQPSHQNNPQHSYSNNQQNSQNNSNYTEHSENEPPYEATEEDNANILKIQSIFMKLTELMGFNVEPEISVLSNKYRIIIKDTPDASLLIGKNGKTIEALQHIVNKISLKENVNKPVYLDIKGYVKQKRKNRFEKRWKRERQ